MSKWGMRILTSCFIPIYLAQCRESHEVSHFFFDISLLARLGTLLTTFRQASDVASEVLYITRDEKLKIHFFV